MARRARKSRAQLQRWGSMVAALRLMNFSFNAIRLYPPTHSEVMASLTKLHETLNHLFEEMEDIGFGFMDELLYIEGAMSLEETAGNQMLVDRFHKCRVKYLTFMKGVTIGDLGNFFSVLNAEALKPSNENISAILEKKGVHTIHIIEAEVDDSASKSKLARKKTLLDWYEKALAVLGAAQTELRDKDTADLKPLYRVVDDMMATVRSKGHEPFLLLPAYANAYDAHLAHNVNVCIYCCVLGDAYRLNTGQINTLCAAALLHDLGRITIPVEWAHDHAPLTLFDRAIAHQHSLWGFMLLARNTEIPPQTALLAAYHHIPSATLDAGGGYPSDVFHKILHTADTFDLAGYRDKYYWKKHGGHRVLMRILRHRGQAFEPALTKLLVNSVGYYPVGSLVKLDDGQRGLVVRPNSDSPARPKIYLFDAPDPPPEPAAAVPAPGGDASIVAPPTPVPDEPPPALLDLMDLTENGLAFKHTITGALRAVTDKDLKVLLDKKKEYLLSHSL